MPPAARFLQWWAKDKIQPVRENKLLLKKTTRVNICISKQQQQTLSWEVTLFCLCSGKAVINHPAQMHVHISASLMKNTSPHHPPKKVHKSLLNNKSLARRKYCINPGCTGPTQHTAALSILCVPAKRPLSPTCSSDCKNLLHHRIQPR